MTGATDATGSNSITKLKAFASQLGNYLKAAMRDVATGAASAERAVGNEAFVDEIAAEAKNESGTAAGTAFNSSAATSEHSLLQASAVDGITNTRTGDGDAAGEGEFWAFRATLVWVSSFA